MKKMKMLKRLSMLLLAMVLVFAFATGCEAKQKQNKTEKETTISTENTVEKETDAKGSAEKETTTSQKQSNDKKNKKDKKSDDDDDSGIKVFEDEEYSTKDEVAAYIHEFGHLPDNYITKTEAQDLGWKSSKGNLWDVAPGKSIGGDKFGNREKKLPVKSGRKYYECDVNYEGGYREADRIIYSNDGLIYFTDDHYNTFELLYGEE